MFFGGGGYSCSREWSEMASDELTQDQRPNDGRDRAMQVSDR